MSITHISESNREEVTYKQVELSFWHPNCWTLEVTDALSGTHIVEKSLYPTDNLVKGDFLLVSEDAPIDRFIEQIDGHRSVEGVAVLKQSADRARAVVNYDREDSIVPDIVNSEFMPVEPVYITDGVEHWTVLVRADRLSDVMESMRAEYDVDLQAVHEADPKDNVAFSDFVDQVSDRLSARQTESLLEARDVGYYNWPRDVSANAVADRLDVSSPTALEHLRKGEQKVLKLFLDKFEKRKGQYR